MGGRKMPCQAAGAGGRRFRQRLHVVGLGQVLHQPLAGALDDAVGRAVTR